MLNSIDRYFGIHKSGSTFGIEIRAGLTTFLAMSYILFVNPHMLSQVITSSSSSNITAELLSATALAAAFGCILMGLFARYPIAVAPGMGLNAYFVYTVVIGHGLSWQVALGAVFVSGVVFLMLSLTGFREAVINGIPMNLKRAVASGIGMFLTMIGLTSSGFIVAKENTLVGLGDITSAPVWIMLLGLLLAVVLMVRRISGALVITMVGLSAVSILFKLPVFNGKVFSGEHLQIISTPVFPSNIAGALDISGALTFATLSTVLTFLFIAFFDTAGTLIGLSEKAKIADSEGRIPRAGRVFITDAVTTSVGALLGTSTSTAYVESATGMEEGGRTGLVAVVVGILFVLSLMFWPMASMVPASATAPALIILGAMMMEPIAKISWDDFSEAVPAFLTLITIPLTWSISTGIGLGVISYVFIRLLTNRMKEVHPIMIGMVLILGIKIYFQ